MNELALFAGAGGGILGGKLLGWTTVCAVEIDPYCREVLLRRQRDKVFSWFPIWDDIRTFDAKRWNGLVDIVTGGFPCQGYSTLGRREGEKDPRNMWPDTIRCIREVEPPLVLLENVPSLIRFDYFGQILGDLEDSGYDAEWDVISASSLGAFHIRKRLWILAWSRKAFGEDIPFDTKSLGRTSSIVKCNDKETRQKSQLQRCKTFKPRSTWAMAGPRRYPTWKAEPGMGRVANGVADWRKRVKALGNGQVPAVAARAFLCLAERAGLIRLVYDPE